MTPKQRYRSTPKGAYNTHKVNAAQRGVPFLLTFEEWLEIWRKSKRYPKRGWRPGQYVMRRYKDAGAYQVGNVYVGLSDKNLAEARMTRKHTARYTDVSFEART